ncbi:bile acid:sodium symporter family protein [Aurantimonas sp. VKM B-3413]|uniref:bile acid:sodium symporter family protein n=1 Tax=Aurantimonas sp. VKM B-3413 TaxID=2779401 RepID=UPI001E61791C|nr:bile acid:sodium symporter family protein [Aurantimonas sp. VKM B-3413]MCB8838323.1 bile acid:sodium symporter [Aurantimonas sp. VKM B-3413]
MRLPKIDPFVFGLAAVVGLAVLWPEPGRSGGLLHWKWVTTYGVCAVFFLYGLTLAPERMRQGLTRWQAHIVVALTTFGVFPLLVLVGQWLAPDLLPRSAEIGFFYVAALPSTVSSSVAMVSLARGDVPVAIFNATISSLIGVFITPLLMTWYMHAGGMNVPLGPTILKVVLLVLLPIVLGQVARIWLAGWAKRQARLIKLADRAVILAIVYGAFCDSVAEGVWQRNDPSVAAEIAVVAVVLFCLVFGVTTLAARLLRMSREERIAVQFCGSKKSLAAGVPLAPVIFAGREDIGLIILPIMLFHFLQLLIVSFIATHHGRQDAEETVSQPAAS